MGDRCERDLLCVSLVDTVLLDELELLFRLVVAANECDDRLDPTVIDAMLAAPPSRAASQGESR